MEIRRAGEPVDVQPQVFAVIEYLIRHRERVVSKEELLDEVWGDRFVGDATLASRIKFARRALGDDGQRQHVIKTIHGRGYRFVADAHEVAATVVVPADRPTSQTEIQNSDRLADASSESLGQPAAEDRWPFVGRVNETEQIVQWHNEGDAGGVLIQGPQGSGTTRLAEECRLRLSMSGQPSWWVQGIASTKTVPLSAISHLIPSSVLQTGHSDADLARADLFRQALEALENRCEQTRPIVVIDDAASLDELSAAVLSTLITNRHVFAVVTARSSIGTTETTLPGELGHPFILRPLELGPLEEIDIDVLLYQVLRGPIDDPTLTMLTAASKQRPGLLRDIIDSCRRTGALQMRAGVWQITDVPESKSAHDWPPEGLSEPARQAAESLALLGPIRIAAALELIDTTGLNELERLGLVTVDGLTAEATVALADPLLETAVRKTIGPLRERALRSELADGLHALEDEPWKLAKLVTWDLATKIDQGQLLGAAMAALGLGDFASATALVDGLVIDETPGKAVIQAELAMWRNQWELAEQLLADIDFADLDDTLLAMALRRKTEIAYWYRDQTDHALDMLEADALLHGESVADALRSRRLMLLTISNRDAEVLDAAPGLAHVTGPDMIEVSVASASAELAHGRASNALGLLDMAEAAVYEHVPEAWRDEGRDYIASIRCVVFLQLGDLAAASAVVATELAPGQRSRLGALPLAGALVEIEANRPRAAREFLRATIASSRRQEFPLFLGFAECLAAQAACMIGHRDTAIRGFEQAQSRLHGAVGSTRWRMAKSVAEMAFDIGRAAEVAPALESLADEAHVSGNRSAEAELRFIASTCDPSPATARRFGERVVELASDFEGRLWPVHLEHLGRLVDDVPLDGLEAAYRELGFVRLAQRIAAIS